MQLDKLIRETKSVCPQCMALIKADIVERDDSIYMVKECARHGNFTLLLSRHPWYYRGLNDFYFSVMTQVFPQRDYIVHLTNACDLRCPICLAGANQRPAPDFSLHELRSFLQGRRNCKIDLMGAEPTTREDLPQIIRMVRKSGNRASLHTNGIRIAGFSYLKSLREAGLNEVHLQFDGFDDEAVEKIRGCRLLQVKMKALENLEKLGVPTDLKVTIVRGVNETQMSKVLDFAVRHEFVKEVFFLGCRYLGRAKDLPLERCLMPDELIDMLEEQTGGRISRQGVFNFQKLYFSLLANFSVKKCFYNQHFLVMREKGGYSPVDEHIDLDGIQKDLDAFKKSRSMPALAFGFLKTARLGSLGTVLPMALSFIRGFDLARMSPRAILLGFISACDAYSYDNQIAANCGKGAVSTVLGVQDIGAMDNIMRDASP